MRLGVLSDTHGNWQSAANAIRAFSREQVDIVIHCGDIGDATLIPLFVDWPTHFVFGNCDYHPAPLRMAIDECGQSCHERFGELTLAGRQIAFLHGDDWRRMQHLRRGGQYDLICSGHTHQAAVEHQGRTIWLNPGALHRAAEYTIAIVELPELDIRHVTVSSDD